MGSRRPSEGIGATTERTRARRTVDAPARLSLASPVGVTVVAIGGWFAAASVYGPESNAVDKGGQLLVSLLLVLTLSAFHEVGHAIAGKIAGLRFRSITVGPVSLVRRADRYRVIPNRHWIRFAGCVEHDIAPGRTKREDLAISALGGPAANLLLATAIFAIGPVSGLWGDFAVWSCFFGLVNLVPMNVNGQTSDGGLVMRLISSRPRDVEWRTRVFGAPSYDR